MQTQQYSEKNMSFEISSQEKVDASLIKYPELIPMCIGMGITYDEAILAMSDRQVSSAFLMKLVGMIVSEQSKTDDEYKKDMAILKSIKLRGGLKLNT